MAKNKLSTMKNFIRNIINPYNFDTFLRGLPKKSIILDVGCGNNSPRRVKNILPNSYYIGIDIQNYNQQSEEFADEYKSFEESMQGKEIIRPDYWVGYRLEPVEVEFWLNSEFRLHQRMRFSKINRLFND